MSLILNSQRDIARKDAREVNDMRRKVAFRVERGSDEARLVEAWFTTWGDSLWSLVADQSLGAHVDAWSVEGPDVAIQDIPVSVLLWDGSDPPHWCLCPVDYPDEILAMFGTTSAGVLERLDVHDVTEPHDSTSAGNRHRLWSGGERAVLLVWKGEAKRFDLSWGPWGRDHEQRRTICSISANGSVDAVSATVGALTSALEEFVDSGLAA